MALKPQQFEAVIGQGIHLMRAGHLQAALEQFQSVLAVQAKHFDALQLSALVYKQAGELETALAFFDRALKINRNTAAVHMNRANTLQALGRDKEALEGYSRTIAIKSDHAQAYFNRGLLYFNAGHMQASIDDFKKALRFKPDLYQAHNSLGAAYKAAGHLDLAIASYEQALAQRPDYPEALNNLGIAHHSLLNMEGALQALNAAIKHRSQYAEAYNHRGVVYQYLKQYDAAVADYKMAISLRDPFPEAWQHLGNLYQETKRLEEAEAAFTRAFSLAPKYPYLAGTLLHTRMHLCAWEHFDEHLAHVRQAIESKEQACLPFALLGLSDDPALQRLCATQHSEFRYPQNGQSQTTQPVAQEKSRIRIAYFSADFHDHATMHLMLDVFKYHDRDRFEIFAYSYGPITGDDWQRELQRYVDHWIDIRELSDQAVAQHAKAMHIDIAIDLKGYTQSARSGIFAQRAAPRQVNFLGYPGTMGAAWMDYVIADDVVIPKAAESSYRERVLRMPHCYQPNCAERHIDESVAHRAQQGLREDAVIFCSFNNSYKLTPDVFASWMRILKGVADSQLWLLVAQPSARQRLHEMALSQGVEPERLVFASYVPVEQHLGRLRCADLFLDSFPYNAHTTASDAIRMDLPLLTRQGESFASRVASSLLKSVSMDCLITSSAQAYEEEAIRLGCDREALAALKAQLINHKAQTTLFDAQRYTKDLEKLYIDLIKTD